jgi:hypothetical protein
MRSFATFLVLTATAASSAIALRRPTPVVPHASWHHPEGHHVERLFRRDANAPPFGSPGTLALFERTQGVTYWKFVAWLCLLGVLLQDGRRSILIPEIFLPTTSLSHG